MLPDTARPEDFVEVIATDCEWFGFVGKIKEISKDTVTVMIFDKPFPFHPNKLKMKARKGTKSHETLDELSEEKDVKRLTVEDINELINFAIDIEDWGYARELVSRKQSMQK